MENSVGRQDQCPRLCLLREPWQRGTAGLALLSCLLASGLMLLLPSVLLGKTFFLSETFVLLSFFILSFCLLSLFFNLCFFQFKRLLWEGISSHVRSALK